MRSRSNTFAGDGSAHGSFGRSADTFASCSAASRSDRCILDMSISFKTNFKPSALQVTRYAAPKLPLPSIWPLMYRSAIGRDARPFPAVPLHVKLTLLCARCRQQHPPRPTRPRLACDPRLPQQRREYKRSVSHSRAADTEQHRDSHHHAHAKLSAHFERIISSITQTVVAQDETVIAATLTSHLSPIYIYIKIVDLNQVQGCTAQGRTAKL